MRIIKETEEIMDRCQERLERSNDEFTRTLLEIMTPPKEEDYDGSTKAT